MKISGERYFPRVGNPVFAPYEPFVSYEHWHRYCYALPFVEGKAVLDIASGEGYGSAFLAEHARLVYGVDISAEAVEHARRTYARENLHFLPGGAESIPIPGEHFFDVIVSFETIEHLDEAGQDRFLAEVGRLLKPDGILLISTPNRETYSKGGVQGNPYHFHEFTEDEFRAFLHRSFAHVRMLSQHVFPASYLWNIGPAPAGLAEYQMRLEDGRFRPGVADAKEVAYLVAVCSQSEERAVGRDSLLLDLSEVAFRGLPHPERWQTASLACEPGDGGGDIPVLHEPVEYAPGFSVEFAVDPTRDVTRLLWHPLEGRLCRVSLRRVLREDGEGIVSRVDLDRIETNGRRGADGTIEFATLDPIVYLPIAGRVARVVIEGECVVDDLPATLVGLVYAVRARDEELEGRDREIRSLRDRLDADGRESRADRDRLGREIEEQARLIEGRGQLIEEQARLIEERGRLIEERGRLIEGRDRLIEEQGRELRDVRAALELAEAELASAFGSLSIRVTAPMRAAGRMARGAWRRGRAMAAGTRGIPGRLAATLRRPARPDEGARTDPGAVRHRHPGHRGRPGHAMTSDHPRPAAAPHADGPGPGDDDPRGEGALT